ncbi:hypothetical protein SDC9_206708 [bioreactor metagenome]|uniref:Uncharacterized protein n=1 Tax=bioreactor metagenome TaxID=1076179 RepID=A0A645J5U2_9ZZZZ
MYKLGMKKVMKEQKARNIEGGLNMVKFTALQCAELFIDKSLGCDKLGVTGDDIDSAIGDSIKLSVEILDKKTPVVDMKAE